MNIRLDLFRWEQETQSLVECFITRYFGTPSEVSYYWVDNEIGGVLSANDYFFNLNDIVDFLRYRYTKKQLFDYYDYVLENMTEKINIKNWKKLK